MSKKDNFTNMFMNMLDKRLQQQGLGTLEDIQKQTDYINEYKYFLRKREKEEGYKYVDWKDFTQDKYFAVYDFSNKHVFVDSCKCIYYSGSIYTTCLEAIYEYVNKIGKEKFCKYILGVDIGEEKTENNEKET